MPNQTEYSRLLLKRTSISGVTPTINTGETIDNNWATTDILVGELFFNIEDDRVFARSNNGIIEFAVASSGASADNYTTAANLIGDTVYFDRTDATSAYTLSLSSFDLEQTLINGNQTNGNNIVTSAGDTIGNAPNVTTGFSGIRFGNDDDGIQIQKYNPDIADPNWGGVKLTLNTHSLIVEESLTGVKPFSGVTYGADYSANFVDRSLVDKSYVDSLFSGGTGIDGGGATNELTYWVDSDTISGGTKTSYFENGSSASLTFENGTYQKAIIGASSSPSVRIVGESNQTRLRVENYSDSADGELHFIRWKGSGSSIEPVTQNTELGSIKYFGGYVSGSSSFSDAAYIKITAAEDWDTNNTGSNYILSTKYNGEGEGVAPVERFSVNGDGTIKMVGAPYNEIHTETITTSFTPDFSDSGVQELTLTGNTTINNALTVNGGGTYLFILKQDGTGGHSVSWGANYKWPDSTAPTVSSGASSVDIITFVADSDDATLYAAAVQNFG